MKHLLLTIATLLFGVLTHAQWYFESSVTSNYLGSQMLENMNGGNPTPTVLDSFKGFKDQSFGLGYLFSFRSLQERMDEDYKMPLMRLGVGIGFDQIHLKTNVIINSVAYPNIYHFSQVYGRLGLYMNPVLLHSKQLDSYGNQRPWLLLDIHGGINFNHYTSATQHYNNTLINLKDPNVKFDDNHLSYFYGLGLQFALGKHTQLYTRYGTDNALNLTEYTDGEVKERYEILKKKISIGVVIDPSAILSHKKNQTREMEALRQTLATPSQSTANDAHASAALEVDSTTKGFLPPRMTTLQRDAIASPATGLTIFNTDTNVLNYYNGTLWASMAPGAGGTNISDTDGDTKVHTEELSDEDIIRFDVAGTEIAAMDSDGFNYTWTTITPQNSWQVTAGSFYTGSTIDLERRLRQHQQGKGANYTRKHRPVVLVYHQEFPTIQEAFRRKKQIQRWSHAKKQALIDGDFDRLSHLSKGH